MPSPEPVANADKNGTGEKKRKRIATACNMCQQRKIRCDGQTPACKNCVNYKTDCVYKQTTKRRAARKGASYIEALEARLGKMESLIKRSGAPIEEEEEEVRGNDTVDMDISRESCEDMITVEMETTVTEHIQTAEKVRTPDSDPTISSLIFSVVESRSPQVSPGNEITARRLTMDLDQERYGESNSPEQMGKAAPSVIDSIASSSTSITSPQNPCIGSVGGFSMFSTDHIQWVTEKTGNASLKDSIYAASEDETRLNYWRPDAFSAIFTRPVFKQLGPKHETIALVNRFFRDFNSVCPLFSQPIFMALLERQYSSNPYDGAGWWASLNIVIAIAISLQSHESSAPVTTYDLYENALGYLQNSLAVFTELSIRGTDLFAVQALLGISLFLQGTSDARPTAALIGTALRICHTLGLHRKPLGTLTTADIEQRKRIFWIAYRLDKDLSVRTGIPVLQDDNDMNVELPDENPEDGLGILTLDNGEGHIGIFRLMAQFSMIETKVHRELYSTKGSEQTWEEVLNRVDQLDSELEDWKEAIPIECQPEYEVKIANSPLSLHLLQMHFAYYNCLRTIHKRAIIGNPMSRSDKTSWMKTDVTALNSRLQSSAAMCLSAARASVRMVRSLPLQDIGFVWRVLYFPSSALLTLFANIVQGPTDSRARSDLRLIKTFVKFLSKLQHEESGEIRRAFKVCSEIERIARDIIAKARDLTPMTGKGNVNRHSLDFNESEDKQVYAPVNTNMLTPESAAQQDNSALDQLLQASSMVDPDMRFNQFTQYFQDMPMFPSGAMLPWNMNSFESSLLPDTFANGTFDFDTNG